MNIKNCFLPCAGFGTRMGSVGKVIPKPLWPLFDSTLLELQVTYARTLGAQRSFINTHHLSELFKDIINEEDLTDLYEKEILGSGGCFHNLKKNFPKVASINIFNPDSF
jgi:NDP-sugar pyrophosphorylase family protein